MIPDELAGIGIEGDDGGGVEIAAGPALSGEDGVGVAGAPVEEIEFGVVSAGHPRHAAAVLHGCRVGPAIGVGLRSLARGVGVPVPLNVAGFGIAGLEEARHNVHAASPPTPTITWFLTMTGEMVQKYCMRSSATFLRQRSLPSLALSETIQQSGVMR